MLVETRHQLDEVAWPIAVIELVDGERLVEIMESRQLGVRRRERFHGERQDPSDQCRP